MAELNIPLASYMAVNYMLIFNRMLYLANCISLESESFEFSKLNTRKINYAVMISE